MQFNGSNTDEVSHVDNYSANQQTTSSVNHTNLIINYLPSTLTEDQLHGYFHPFGPIISHKIIVNKQTGMSMGFGFVKFEQKDHAQQAIKAMNGYKIENKRLKVALALPPKKAVEPSNLYLAGLPLTYTVDDLKRLVINYGEVVEALVMKDKATGLSRGAGFCRMGGRKQAVDAIAALNGKMLEGSSKKLVVKFADEQIPGAKKKRPLPNIFGLGTGIPGYGPSPFPRTAGYVPRFNPLGQGQHAVSHYPSFHSGPQYPSTSQFHNPQFLNTSPFNPSHSQYLHGSHSASLASGTSRPLLPMPNLEQNSNMNQLHEIDPLVHQSVMNNSLRGAGAQDSVTPGVALFVYHIPQGCVDSDLYDVFSMYGEILSIKIIRNPQTGENKGYGFVNMAEMSQAQEAIKNLNGYQMGHKYLQVKLKT